jgi:REP element-mobilizing transposase RayT
MPRGPRLNASGSLHHLMARGIERRSIFITEPDRLDFLSRLDRLVEADALRVFAFALMPNHFHILARTGSRPISRAMSSLLTGYAVSFNHRHTRVGHLFQNRFKSTLCEEAGYFVELVRYIHLNPIRAGITASIDELDHDPATGHAAIIGNQPARFLDVDYVLSAFGSDRDVARLAYRAFVLDGLDATRMREQPRRGTVRTEIAMLAEPTRREKPQERILGSNAFLNRIHGETVEAVTPPRVPLKKRLPIESLIDAVAAATGASRAALAAARRIKACCAAREGLAYLWLDCFRGRVAEVAAALSISEVSAYRAAARGRRQAERWIAVLNHAARLER